MRTKDDWEFQTIGRGLKEVNVNDESYVAHRDGVLDFLPYELEMVEWPPHPNGTQNMEYVSFAAHAQHAKFDKIQHEKDGHYPKAKGCSVCERAFMQRTGAFKGGLERSSKRGLNTLNVDLLDWVTLDNNGDRYTLTGAVLGTTFPAVRQQPAKSGVVTAKSVREVKHEIEVLTDPGGTNGYAIQRVHKDQGSEFKSEHLDDCMAGNVKSTTGEEEKHTDGTLVEGFNKVLEYTCTALGLTAIDDSEVAIRCHGELANHACDLIRMRSRTAFQKEAGISCWREQTLTDHDATLKDSCRWGSLAFGYVKKENRQNKLDERAYQAIFGGWDKEILGAARLIPFEIQDDGEVVLFMTKVTKTFRLFDGTFPLLRNGGECVYPAETREWVDGDELQLFVPETAAAGSEWVVEQLLAKNVYCTDTGAAE